MALSSYLYGKQRYQVVADLVIIPERGIAGENRHFYRDAILPSGVPGQVIEEWLADGLIRVFQEATA